MEEVDKIIIHSFRSIGCDIDDDVQSITQFSTELIVEATAACLRTINHEAEVPHKLPPSMSARFRVGTALATAIMNLGYQGEVGYQTFLYSNESEVRRVFMFLIEKLPRESGEAVEETLGASDLLRRSIAAEIGKQLQSPWTPSYFKKKSLVWRGNPRSWHKEGCSGVLQFQAYHLTSPQGITDLTQKVPKDRRNYYKREMPLVTAQPARHTSVAASILETHAAALTAQQERETEWNTAGLSSRLSPEEYRARKRQRLQKKLAENIEQSMNGRSEERSSSDRDLLALLTEVSNSRGTTGKTKGSRFTHTEKLQFAQDDEKSAAQLGVGEGPRVDSQEDLEKKREEEVEALREQLGEINKQVEKLDLGIKKIVTANQQMNDTISVRGRERKDKEETIEVKRQTLDLLPNAEENIEKLKGVIEGSRHRLMKLAGQWENRRAPLLEQLRLLQQTTANQASEAEDKLEAIRELREKMKQVASEARGKEDMHKQLVSEYERMTKDVSRSAYTRKIMEIVSNIKKQTQEIDKILLDTKNIQKEINMMSGKLDRTFTVTDELIFKDAKKDEAVRKAYKYLASLHENCSVLVKTVEETGFIVREIRDLEDQIEQESKKKVVSNLDKITADYQQLKAENSTLLEKFQKQKKS